VYLIKFTERQFEHWPLLDWKCQFASRRRWRTPEEKMNERKVEREREKERERERERRAEVTDN
jgi:hypothetical protein